MNEHRWLTEDLVFDLATRDLEARGIPPVDPEEGYTSEDVTCFEIPAGFDIVGENAFYNYSNLEEVVIPEGVIFIGRSAFKWCAKLEYADLPSTLLGIDDHAFESCVNLRNIKFPEGLELIGESAFEGCKGLKKLDIPGTVKDVKKKAFYRCRNVRKVRLHEGTLRLGVGAFGDIFKLWHFNFSKLPDSLEERSYDSRRSTAFVGSTCRISFFRHPFHKISRYLGKEVERRPYQYSSQYGL